MAFVLNDRVKETTTTTGTGTVNLGGAATGFETFVAGVGNSNSTYYCIAGQTTAEFEVGIGTVTDASPDTLSRTTILSSSNSDSAVDFSAGTKDVFCTLPAAKTIREFDTAVNIPTGTTAQRSSSAAAGDFRYNTSTGRFEGYSSAWNALGGSNTFSTDIFAGDGSDTTFTLSQSIENENDLFVFIDGVFQAHNSYSVSGTTLTFSTAPANSRVITAYSVKSAVSGNNVTISTMDGDGSDTTLTLAADPVNENNVQVYIDGVYQNKDTFAVSGTTLTFSAAPPNGTKVEAITLTQTNINTATQLADADGDTKVQVEESSDEDKIRFDIAGTEEMVMDATGIVINDGSNNRDFRIESNGQTHALFVDGGLDNIGIGYSAAHTAINKGLVILTGDGNGGIQLNKEDGSYPSSGETLGSIGWKGADSANSNAAAGASIVGIAAEDFSGSTEATNLAFNTKPSGTGPGSAPSERMRIDSAGNVGIGDTSPSTKLDVTGVLRLGGTSSTDQGTQLNLYSETGGNGHMVAYQLVFDTGSNNSRTERMRIDSSGNVGIGDTSPAEKLEVAGNILASGSDGTARSLTLGNTSGNHSSISVDGSGHLNLDAETAGGLLLFKTAGTERMRIDSSGNVGIGGTPTSKFHILDSSSIHAQMVSSGGDAKLSLVASDSHDAFINFSGATNEMSFGYDRGTSAFIFSNGDTLGSNERMRITSAGSVIINRTSTIGAEVFTVQASGNSSNCTFFKHATTDDKSILNTIHEGSTGSTSRPHLVTHNVSGSQVGSISANGSSTAYNTSSDARLKDVTGEARGLEVINELNHVAYNCKESGQADEGLIAQEVLDIVPNAVTGSEEKYYQMDYSKLVVHLVKGMKEQQTLIETLQAKVEALENG